MAHVLAAAVQKLWPDVKFGGGPAIENGFYYDFDMAHRLTEADFPKIEKEMRELIKGAGQFVPVSVSVTEAKEIFQNEPLKLEWIDDIADTDTDTVTIYKFRNFTDLCRGPHVENSKELPRDAFKIRSVAGAYWRGDSKNKMLQRVYVDAFLTKEELDAHLHQMEEAAKRDNRRLCREMELCHFESEYAPGMVFWHDKGLRFFRKFIDLKRAIIEKAGYTEIATPEVMNKCLWETSGHWAKYASKNFVGQTLDDEVFVVKPMSCPGGMLVFAQGIKSYRDLPMHVAEFGKVHRYESSGSLSGLMRVRGITQDDAHIYCTEEQLESEIVKLIKMIKETYSYFGLDGEITMKLATRPESEFRIGSDEIWDKAEAALKSALDKNNMSYTVEEGDAAFYGPKIDNYIKDSIGRIWQCGTIQLDMNLPERFDLSYVGADNQKHRPLMLHCAVYGSIERFAGILLESTGGHLPLWLSPEPVVVIPVSEKYDNYANDVVAELRAAGVRARTDLRNEKVQYKIRELSLSKTPIIAVVGEAEMGDKTITLRYLGSDKQETRPLAEFIEWMKKETKLPA